MPVQRAAVNDTIEKFAREQMQKLAAATQFSPNSESNAEKPGSEEPAVDAKLKNKGEGYANVGQSEFGVTSNRLLIENNPSVPLADKGNTLDETHAETQIPGQTLDTVLDSAGDPTMSLPDPQSDSSEPEVSEKLKLQKDAEAILEKMKELAALEVKLADYIVHLAVGNKESAPMPSAPAAAAATAETTAKEASNLAAEEIGMPQIKAAMTDMIDSAFYAANVIALDRKQRKEAEAKAGNTPAAAANTNSSQPLTLPNVTPPKVAALPPGGEAVDPSALAAMTDMGGGTEEDLMAASLEENGVDPAMWAELEAMGGGGEPEMEGDPSMEGGLGGLPPELLQDPEVQEALGDLMEALAQVGVSGVSFDELGEAQADLSALDGAGVAPEEAVVADEEAVKTGHFKFASFINRPSNKTAEEVQRAAKIRMAVRDYTGGPTQQSYA